MQLGLKVKSVTNLESDEDGCGNCPILIGFNDASKYDVPSEFCLRISSSGICSMHRKSPA